MTEKFPHAQGFWRDLVDNITASLKPIEAAGGRVLTPRKEIGANMGAFADFVDPVGNEFGLYEESPR